MPRPTLGKLLLDLADSVPHRQNTRVPIVIPIRISGRDKGGLSFQEGTQTIDVGKRGVRTSILHRLATDARIGVSDAAVGKVCPARVVWQAHKDSTEGRVEIGVELLESLKAKSMWALATEPSDWQTGRLDLSASEKLEYFWARMKTLPGSPDLRSMVDSAESLSAEALGYVAATEREIEPANSSTQVSLPDAINDDKNSGTVNGAESAAARPPGDTRWRDKTQREDPAPTASNPPTILREPTISPSRFHADQARGAPPLKDLNRLAQVLSQQADIISKGVDKTLDSVRSATEDAVAKLHDVQQQIESRLETVGAEQQKRLAGLGDSSAEECRLKAEASLSNLREQLQQMETQMGKIGSDYRRPNAAESALDENKNHEAALADFRNQLQQSLDEFRERTANVVQDELRTASASLRKLSAREQKELQDKNAEFQLQNVEFISDRMGMLHQGSYAPRPQRGSMRIVWALALFMTVMAALAAFTFLSTQPTRTLETEPPAEFTDTNVHSNLRPVEEQLARAYWSCAVQVIQGTYRYGRVLPDQPPPEFSVQPQQVPAVSSKPYLEASRTRYWQRLRQVWNNPQIWVQTYEWNTDWLTTPLKSLGLMLRR